MRHTNENTDNSLNKKETVTESNDIREHKHESYNALNDLNKTPSSLNESKPMKLTDDYNVKEMLTENKIY